jgi:peptidylprolyl isomerase
MNTTHSFLTRAGIALLLATPQFISAQTATTTKPPVHHTATAAKTDTIKLPANIPALAGPIKSLYALRYIDSKIGTGELAQPGMIYSVHYTGWLYNGTKFDSSVERGTPIEFRQGQLRVIIGWDTGFDGMRVGGKRRLFIPYQLAYGANGKGPIPAKSDLIFDVELVAVKDPNAPPPAPPAQ